MSSLKIKWGNVNALLYSPFGEVPQYFNNIVRNTAFRAQATANVNTGTMVTNIKHETVIRRPIIDCYAGILRPQIEPFRPFDSGKTPRPSVADVVLFHHKQSRQRKPKGDYLLRWNYKLAPKPVFSEKTRAPRADYFLLRAFQRSCPYRITVLYK